SSAPMICSGAFFRVSALASDRHALDPPLRLEHAFRLLEPDPEVAMDMAEQRSLKGKVSDAEWQVRVDLAACYRLIAHFHWDDLVFTHVTARVPGTESQFLINPYGMMFDEITASSLVRI